MTIVTWQSHQGPSLAQANGFDIIACSACGFRHVVPVPTLDDLQAHYREDYYGTAKPTFLSRSAEDQAWAELGQNDRLASFERLIGPERRRLLGIGCGPGFFLKTAQNRGWQVKGLEPSRQAAAHARGLGLDITEGFFEPETAATLGRFDAIDINNVLEHVHDPIGFLERACALIDPGGLVCIGVPNDFSPLQQAGRQAVGAPQWWLAPPHHLNYFDFDSGVRLLERLGLKVVERTTSFPMELFLMMGENYIGKDDVGRSCHTKRKRFDLAFEEAGLGETRRLFYRALAAAGLGREAVLIGQKP